MYLIYALSFTKVIYFRQSEVCEHTVLLGWSRSNHRLVQLVSCSCSYSRVCLTSLCRWFLYISSAGRTPVPSSLLQVESIKDYVTHYQRQALLSSSWKVTLFLSSIASQIRGSQLWGTDVYTDDSDIVAGMFLVQLFAGS